MTRSIRDLLFEFFSKHPNQEFEHGPVVDWVTEQWLLEHDTPPRDPWRSIRALHQEGVLIKVRKGVYKYDPQAVIHRELEDFTLEQKEQIFRRDNYRCVICGRGRQDGVEIHADHIKPKDKGGKAEQVVVGLDAQEDDLVLYFDSNLALTPAYLKANNLYARARLNQDPALKGYFDDNGRVKPQKFRGENSYGFVAKLNSLTRVQGITSKDVARLKEGDQFVEFNGVKICHKYIAGHPAPSKEVESPKLSSPMFVRHWETHKFMREMHRIVPDQLVYIEEKIHGTSFRIGKALVNHSLSWVERFLLKLGFRIDQHEYTPLHGTRRTILGGGEKDTFYKRGMRNELFANISPKLYKGEQVFGEIFGFEINGVPIQKGFPYGCRLGENKAILYRVTQNNEDGKVFDLGREYVYRRADELGLLRPPLFAKYHYTGSDESKAELIRLVKHFTEGGSAFDSKTLREGVVVWFTDERGAWTCLKNKSFTFLAQESKAKDKGVVDMEDLA